MGEEALFTLSLRCHGWELWVEHIPSSQEEVGRGLRMYWHSLVNGTATQALTACIASPQGWACLLSGCFYTLNIRATPFAKDKDFQLCRQHLPLTAQPGPWLTGHCGI